MSNPAYERGRRFEWERKDYWEGEGYEAMRTAGSHGAFDIIAVHPVTCKVILEQCKVVEDQAKGEKIVKAWTLKAPLPIHPNYTQRIVVKVHGKGYLIEGEV